MSKEYMNTVSVGFPQYTDTSTVQYTPRYRSVFVAKITHSVVIYSNEYLSNNKISIQIYKHYQILLKISLQRHLMVLFQNLAEKKNYATCYFILNLTNLTAATLNGNVATFNAKTFNSISTNVRITVFQEGQLW